MRFYYAFRKITPLILLCASASFAQSSTPVGGVAPESALTAAQLRNLLGKSIDSEEAKQAIDALSRGAERSEAPEWDTTFVSSTEAGVSLKFSGTPRSLSLVVLYAEGIQESKQYPQSLPNGLAFGQSRREVERRLGPPMRSMGVEGYPFEAEYPQLGLSLSFIGRSMRDADATLTQVVLLPVEPDTAAASTQPAAVASPRLTFRLIADGPAKDPAKVQMLDETDAEGNVRPLPTLRSVILDERDVAWVGLTQTETSRVRAVMLEMTPDGAKRLEKATAANIGRRMAIVLDGRPLIVPTIRGAISKHVVIEPGEGDSKNWVFDVAGRLHAAVNAITLAEPTSQPSDSNDR